MTQRPSATLPDKLKNRLNLIKQTVPQFWQQQRHAHFIRCGPSHSERIQQKLENLIEQLPATCQLSPDEIFVGLAAAWLYEIGMQSPNLGRVLNFEWQPGDMLSTAQREEIRAKKHLLTAQLIQESVSRDYHGPSLPLGLTQPPDDYVRCIIEVCRWCSDEPLTEVPEIRPVEGENVRIRLLVALLRLADQLYINKSRVDLGLLERFKPDLPSEQYAKWWCYHYTQISRIDKTQIRFHYLLPTDYENCINGIRRLIETSFERVQNPAIHYLVGEYGFFIAPYNFEVQYDPLADSQSKLPPDLFARVCQGMTPPAPSPPLPQHKFNSPGIPPKTYARLRETLLNCGPFNSDSELLSIFVDDRIAIWRNSLPEADSRENRVEFTINFLHKKHNAQQQNALVLLLHVLSDRIQSQDACYSQLTDLAGELESLMKAPNGSRSTSNSVAGVDLNYQQSQTTRASINDRMKGERMIKILFLAANPLDTDALRLDQESRAMDEALRQAEFRDRFDIRQQWAVRVTDLQGYLLRHSPDIVHFSGHGSTSSEIILEDSQGDSHPVSPRALSRLFSVLKDNIRCVVLNACYSEAQAQAIAEHIDCVVGMSDTIGDAAAISFAAAFYQALGYGRDVKTAFDLGCIQIDMENLDEQDIPKLICLRTDPAQVKFVQ